MRLWIDGQCLQTSSRQRGIGRYMHELIGGIGQHQPRVELSISFNAAMPDEAIAARAGVARWIAPGNIHIWQGIAEGGDAFTGHTQRRQLSELALAHHVAVLAPDIALSASPFEGTGDCAVPLLPQAGLRLPIAAVFYDAIPHRYPARYLDYGQVAEAYDRRFKAHAGFDILLGISRFAAREAAELFPEVTSVAVDAGPSSSFLPQVAQLHVVGAGQPALPPGIAAPFVLYVGALDWRKNVDVVVDAFQRLPLALSSSLALVIGGSHYPDQAVALRRRWRRHGLPPDNLVMLGHVPDGLLGRLYKSAAVVVQPSWMEGFGLTALEAMICGAPVLCADAGALPEVVGDARALFDPADPGELARLLADVVTNDEVRRALIDAAKSRIGLFSWQRTAGLAVAALRDVHALKGKASPSSAVSRATLRRETAALADQLGVEATIAAPLLAIAENQGATAPRLIVDLSCIAERDLGTGIQRVVREITQCWTKPARDGAREEIKLASCAHQSAYVEVAMAGDTFVADATAAVRLGGADTVLLLDSTWEYHARHAIVLRKARLQGCQVITTLYDMIPLRLPGFCAPGVPTVYREGFRTALQVSTGFVCISRAVADEFVALLQAIQFPRPMRVGYWPLGADFAARSRDEDEFDLVLPAVSAGPATFLMVGTLEPRKGHRIALEAFQRLWQDGVDARLVIVGRVGWGVSHLVAEIEASPELRRRLFRVDGADDMELAEHYRACDAVIAASYAEGFGLPIIEARGFGKPVIASDIAVFHEVAGAGADADFFEVGDAASLAAAVRRFLDIRGGKDTATAGASPSWTTWAGSAARLEAVVTGGDWYKTYVPVQDNPYGLLTDLGETQMRAGLAENERGHKLELIDGPHPVPGENMQRFVVALTNLSGKTWSSMGPAKQGLGIFLGYRVVDAGGRVVAERNGLTPIPFVLPPGDTHVMAVDVPLGRHLRAGASVAIEVIQDQVGWFGNALRVAVG